MNSRLEDPNYEYTGVKPRRSRVRCEEISDNFLPSSADFLLSDPALKAQLSECLLDKGLEGRGGVLFFREGAIWQSPPLLENPCFDSRIQGGGQRYSPSSPIASTGQPSIASLHMASSSGDSGCL